MRTAILIVNWNGGLDTLECLKSIRQSSEVCDVYICDNASTDASLDQISSFFDELGERCEGPSGLPRDVSIVTLWQMPKESSIGRAALILASKNDGFAAGNNIAFSVATSISQYSFVFLLNNDTLINNDTVAALVGRLESDPGIGVCGGTLIYADRPDCCQGVGGVLNLISGTTSSIWRDGPVCDLPKLEAVEGKIDYVMGAAMMLKSELYEALGGLSTDYFLYFEELDFARRLPPGVRMGWAPSAKILHKVGGTIGTSQVGRSSNLAIYYGTRSKIIFYKKYYVVLLPVIYVSFFKSIVAYIVRRDLSAARWVLTGMLHALNNGMMRPEDILARGVR